jgi:tight adherence protein B
MSEKTLFLIMIFVVVTLLSFAFISPITSTSGRTRRLLRKRLRGMTRSSQFSEISLTRRQYLLSLRPWERSLETSLLLSRLRGLMEKAGLEQPAYRMALLMVLCAVLSAGVTGFLLPDLRAIAIAVIAGFVLPVLWLLVQRSKRLRQFEEQLPDGINLLTRSLRAGMPFGQALGIAGEEIGGPVGKEFSLVFSEVNYGGDLREALFRMIERMPIVPVMALVSSIMIQRDAGGNLAELLERIENLLRQRFRFMRKVKTLTASNRMSAWTVGIMPFALSAMLETIRPGWVTSLFETPNGRNMVLAAFIMQAIGVLWIRQMTRLSV